MASPPSGVGGTPSASLRTGFRSLEGGVRPRVGSWFDRLTTSADNPLALSLSKDEYPEAWND